jgi:hypothetical protein
MAQTRRRRRRKHRGTQGGSIDRRRAGGRPRSRQEARAKARKQMVDRRDIRPTWRSSVNRALIAAGIFVVLLILLFGQKPLQAIGLGVFMLAFYIPMGYGIDLFLYNRRQAQKQRAAQEAKAARRGGD